MARPVIALLTDFGTKDHYVGAMKGVALSICPDVTFVDITHDIAPHDTFAGALELAAAYRYFPAGTVFLVVVDPGVGSHRRGIAVEAGAHRFVGPDNGLLSVVLRETPPTLAVELTEQRYARPTVSRTFEGRDRFSPAAGWLAAGVDLSLLGRRVDDWFRLDVPVAVARHENITGEVVRVDRFGNLITNVDRGMFEEFAADAPVSVAAGSQTIGRVVTTYSEVESGAACALFGSSNHLEIAVNSGSAAARLRAGRGTAVVVTRLAPELKTRAR
jgi:S-adenosylmethionine hydrolase